MLRTGPMRPSSWLLASLGSALTLAAQGALADSMLTLQGTITEADPEHVEVPFQVPAGTAEIQIDHDDLAADDILDWGLWSPEGFRGWGGGNTEPLVVSADAASRSYLPGPITAGEWRLDVGRAKLSGGSASYDVTVTFRDQATLGAQPERSAYAAPGPVLSPERRWYAGDFHVHSRESGDAAATFDEIIALARSRGLDFVELSDHNTTAQLDFYSDLQGRTGDLLFIPGVEFTTYHGHANGIGATEFVDFRIGLPDVTIDAAARAFQDQGALLSINHPAFELGDACIGCAWDHELAPGTVSGIEVATAGSAQLFYEQTSAIWEQLASDGHRLAALGGSDDHRAGEDLGAFGTPIGSPTTMVLAEGLSTAAILDAIRAGRTVVKVRGPGDPMVELSVSEDAEGARVTARISELHGVSYDARWVIDGAAGNRFYVGGSLDFATLNVVPAADHARRVRLEIFEGASPVTLTSHVWIEAELGTTEPVGGACAVPASPSPRSPSTPNHGAIVGISALALAAALAMRRGRRADS